MLRAGGHRGQLKSFTNLSKSSIIFTAADSSKGAKVYQTLTNCHGDHLKPYTELPLQIKLVKAGRDQDRLAKTERN